MNIRSWVAIVPPSLRRPLLHGLMVFLAAVIYSITLPNHFISVARILPLEGRSGSAGGGLASAAAAAIGISLPGQDSADATYIDILNSHWLRTELLDKKYTFNSRTWLWGKAKAYDLTLRDYRKAKTTDHGLRLLGEMLRVNRDMKTKLITVEAETTSPKLSQELANATVDLLNIFVVEKSKTRGAAKARFAEQRLMEARAAKANAENAYFSFLGVNRNYLSSIDPSVRLDGLRLEEGLKLRQQIVATLAISYEQALMEEKNDSPILNILDQGNLPEEKSGPRRATNILLLTILAVAASWVWTQRHWIASALATDGGQA